MAITDELRHNIEGAEQLYGRECPRLTAIADRIDAAHEEALREAYTKGREDGMGMANAKDAQAEYLRGKNDGYDEGWDAGFASADDWLAQHEDAMAVHGWVKLPKDADGEPIHMGDLVTVPWKDKVYEVAGFSCTKQLYGGIRTIWIDVYSPEKQRNVPLCGADSCRHYHAPTVEDVLREMADRCYADEDEPRDRDAIVAEYAAKLQLRGDVE